MSELSVKHLLGIKYLNEKDIQLIFETADHFKEVINRSIKWFLNLLRFYFSPIKKVM